VVVVGGVGLEVPPFLPADLEVFVPMICILLSINFQFSEESPIASIASRAILDL